jgi:hypothetical protein
MSIYKYYSALVFLKINSIVFLYQKYDSEMYIYIPDSSKVVMNVKVDLIALLTSKEHTMNIRIAKNPYTKNKIE